MNRAAVAQTASTGAQQTIFAGLHSAKTNGLPAGQFRAVASDGTGNLFLLLDQGDGVRILKMDGGAQSVLAQAQMGTAGDHGIALALDPSGNVYITGTTSSGTLTSTAGAAFPTTAGAGTNGFVARLDSSLHTVFVTFAGATSLSPVTIAATPDAVFVAGSIFAATLPVTPNAILQAPPAGTNGNGFIERFSADGASLAYATYLGGPGGNTSVAAMAADVSDNVYVGGYTGASGLPTVAALVPQMLGTSSGFVAKLTPAGDGFLFSTFIPGSGVTSVAVDAATSTLLVSGGIALGQFPITNFQGPLAPLLWQVVARLPLDGSTVQSATAVAPGSHSFVAASTNGTAWVAGDLTLPLLSLTALSDAGDSFVARIVRSGAVDETVRLGGIADSNNGYASAPVAVQAVASADGDLLSAGQFAPSASGALLGSQTFDLPLSATTAALPSTVHDAVLPASACNGSLCPGAAAYLSRISPVAGASLLLSADDAPNLTLRNLGTIAASGLQIATANLTETDNCGSSLAGGGECSIALGGSGPGSVTVQAANASTQTRSIPAMTASALPVVLSPKELDFGVVSSAGSAAVRVLTISNLTSQPQTFNSTLYTNAKITLPYSIAEQSTDCALAGGTMRTVAANSSCHITLSFTASSSPANDGAVHAYWMIGTRMVELTAFGQAAALTVSASEIDFGAQAAGAAHLPRYLYLANNSTSALAHAVVTLPATSPFVVSDGCPGSLAAHTMCQLTFTYQATHAPSTDSVTLNLDQGLSVLVTGSTLAPNTASGTSVNPSLTLSTTALTFAAPVPVTGISSSPQSVTVTNNGPIAFAVTTSITGDFIQSNNCGASLPGGASCSILVNVAPSAAGTRNGLLSVTAGSSTSPATVSLSGSGTDILSPASNGTLDLGTEPVGQPNTAWYKITQSFTSFAATVSSTTLGTPYTAVLVEDIGYGHGNPPPTAFHGSASGTCFNCWLGIRFDPVTNGIEAGVLSLSSASSGNPYVLALTGSGQALAGLAITPSAQDFGSVTVHSVTAPLSFVVTNLSATLGTLTLSAPAVTGDFALSSVATGGSACGGALAYGDSCVVPIVFVPTTTGSRSGQLTLNAGSISAIATLTGYGLNDPGVALNPSSLVFQNVPGPSAIAQTVTLTNTGSTAIQVNGVSAMATSSGGATFQAATTCTTLDPGASCSIAVSFTPGLAQSAGTLSIPVTGAQGTITYSVPLTSNYTLENEGLQVTPGQVVYGPLASGSMGTAQQVTINNLTGKALALSVGLPRQFVLNGSPCSGLAAGASCSFSVASLPLTNGTITGTIFAIGTPIDGSATVNGLGYVESYGVGSGSLTITGGISPGNVLSFGQIPSGQTAEATLTLTNTSTIYPLTIRRLSTSLPFLATSTCGATLAPGSSCAVNLTYAPLNQVGSGATPAPSRTDSAQLTIESDATSAPNMINLTGSVTPVSLGAPSNAAPIPMFTASQSSLTFPTIQAGNLSAVQTVTLSNTGTGTIHILGLQTTADFSVTSDCSELLSAQSCTVFISFTPQISASSSSLSVLRAGAVEIASDSLTPLEFVSVVGTTSPSPLTLSQTSLNFGAVPDGAAALLPLALSNTGSSGITFGALTANGDYMVGSGTCPQTGLALAPGASCMLQITFAPVQAGVRAGTLSIATSANTLPVSVSLSGTGVQSHLVSTPTVLGFGSVSLGASSSLNVTLTNSGTSAVTGVALATTTGYSVSTPCSTSTLAPGASCTATITFSPTGLGPLTGSLTITSSDPSSPGIIPLSGNGISSGSFSLSVDGGISSTVSVRTGATASFVLTVTPSGSFAGTVVLNCSPIAPIDYGYCSLVHSSLSLGNGAQTAKATVSTVASIAANDRPLSPIRWPGKRYPLLCLVLPALALSGRNCRGKRGRRVYPLLAVAFATALLTLAGGCGGGGPDPNLRYSTPGSYQYQVTASSVGASVQITQTVTLNLTVTR